jgi:uncharacterized paraquat-inducible protein A
MTQSFPEPPEHVICPNCGKPVTLPKMNVCYRAQLDCESCGASILIEGDKVTLIDSPDTP